MTWSEPGTVNMRRDRRSGVRAESERFGQLPAHVNEVFPERVLHPVGPPIRRGFVLELGDDDVRITSAVVTRPVISEHRAASLPGCAVAPRLQGDRKSTRLNSSHVSISYAVFCLKKKNVGV